eukprot:scaffold255252_cov30-Tisochrysis_lutea.AAC.4
MVSSVKSSASRLRAASCSAAMRAAASNASPLAPNGLPDRHARYCVRYSGGSKCEKSGKCETISRVTVVVPALVRELRSERGASVRLSAATTASSHLSQAMRRVRSTAARL